uniref:Uncharacterized protein n=1 Tax=Chromera velia CCMP2878 TaxID=1169474 RepID=A0A0G4F0M7_9ALVE|eukprot:Cvel_14502.t1-p1 / transcript=Cvel_14502.t1 / gene=Cvel_14502 / organism=Chromera_velia_CCMP2878 / gene_product=hypothetical protein / transcript_product=hypothetical protein / location=Cvel_scaffold1034:31472-36349(+) / protein_length=388 / sequence_SO=supercontig / SO=protein_coding / is_pseudo=false
MRCQSPSCSAPRRLVPQAAVSSLSATKTAEEVANELGRPPWMSEEAFYDSNVKNSAVLADAELISAVLVAGLNTEQRAEFTKELQSFWSQETARMSGLKPGSIALLPDLPVQRITKAFMDQTLEDCLLDAMGAEQLEALITSKSSSETASSTEWNDVDLPPLVIFGGLDDHQTKKCMSIYEGLQAQGKLPSQKPAFAKVTDKSIPKLLKRLVADIFEDYKATSSDASLPANVEEMIRNKNSLDEMDQLDKTEQEKYNWWANILEGVAFNLGGKEDEWNGYDARDAVKEWEKEQDMEDAEVVDYKSEYKQSKFLRNYLAQIQKSAESKRYPALSHKDVEGLKRMGLADYEFARYEREYVGERQRMLSEADSSFREETSLEDSGISMASD